MSRHKWNSKSSFLVFLSLVLATGLGTFFAFSSITPAHAATQATLYAVTDWCGSACSLAAPCSLSGAQAKVRLSIAI